MKRTVGLTAFFSLMNLCEKKGLSINVYAGLLLFKKVMFFEGVKKTIFPTRQKGCFSAKLDQFFYRGDAEARGNG